MPAQQPDPDYSNDAQRAAELALRDAVDLLFDTAEDDIPDTAFCGCEVCTVRTVLEAAWPYLYAAARDGRVPAPPDPYLTD